MNSFVAITGANGFIGSHITELFVSRGVSVKCVVRKNSKQEYIKDVHKETAYADVTDFYSLKKAFNGSHCVIHNASLVKDWGNYNDFYKTNVEGTLNVLNACKANGISRVIITGSISSYGEENFDGVKDENSPYRSHYSYFADSMLPAGFNFYRDTKAMATQMALEFAKKEQLDLIVLEPVWVYGEREFNSVFFQYLVSVKKGMCAMPGSSQNKFHVIYAPDLARAYLLAYKKHLKGAHRIIIGNRSPVLMTEIYSLFCNKAGIKKPFLLPKSMVYPVGFFWEVCSLLFKKKEPPLLMRSRVNMFYDNIEYDVSKAKEILGFENDFSLEEGISRTVEWYRSNGYL